MRDTLRSYTRALSAIAGIALIHSAPARAETFATLNAIRQIDCAAKVSAPPLIRKSNLDRAAALVHDGAQLKEALRQAGYRADQTSIIRIGGKVNDLALRKILTKGHCESLSDTALTEVGFHQTKGSLDIVLAAPFTPPNVQDAAKVEREVLQLVNIARAKPRRCGTKNFQATSALTISEKLHVTALGHARDMAQRGVVTHDGANGSTPGDRAIRAGYIWKAVGENVAGGQLTADEVVASWLASPGHCGNIMDPDFSQLGLAYVINTDRETGIFWALVFGHPK